MTDLLLLAWLRPFLFIKNINNLTLLPIEAFNYFVPTSINNLPKIFVDLQNPTNKLEQFIQDNADSKKASSNLPSLKTRN